MRTVAAPEPASRADHPAPLLPLPPRKFRIDRRELLAKLDAARTKVIVIVAPAGTGKTTLLRQWSLASSRRCGSITLVREHNQLSTFLDDLTSSLSELAPGLVEGISEQLTLLGHLGKPADIRVSSTVLLHQIAHHPFSWTLILDDCHNIIDADVFEFINQLIAAMPDDCRLIIAGRTEPALPVARLRVLEELESFTTIDLRATVAEVGELFKHLGVTATDEQLQAIEDGTTGWMVAVHLVALSSQSIPLDHVIESLESFDGNLDLLGDYLLHEVLSQQSPELRAFLLQCSILDHFTADSCLAVTGNSGVQSLLDQAQRVGLFIAEWQEDSEWLTFQHPFRVFLRRRLRIEFPADVVAQLHINAGRWYWQNNHQTLAIVHTVRGQDWAFARSMAISVAYELLSSDRLEELAGWVRAFPRDTLLADPNLSTILAYVMVRVGNINECSALIDAAEKHWAADALSSGLALVSLTRGAIGRFRDDATALLVNSARGIELMTDEKVFDADGHLRDITPRRIHYTGTWAENPGEIGAYQHLMLGLLHHGRLREATNLFEKIEHAYLSGENVLTFREISLIKVCRLPIQLAHGHLEMAAATGEELVRQIQSVAPADVALGIAALVDANYELDRLGHLDALLQSGIEGLERAGIVVYLADLHIRRARLQCINGDIAAAQATLDVAAVAATSLHNLVRVREIGAMRAAIALATGDIASAQHWAMTRNFVPEMSSGGATLPELQTYARLLIALDESEAALGILTPLCSAAERDGRQHDRIAILVRMSLASLNLFDLDQAVATLGEALVIGEAGGYRRVFLDEGAPMLRLLRIAHRRGLAVNYIRELLLAAGETPGDVVRMTHRELIEPITAREIEVLGLVTLGLTNKEISDELYLSVATVKRHITNLYGKLGVSSRTEAVQRARRLGLLSSEQGSRRTTTHEPAENILNEELESMILRQQRS